MNVLCRVVLLAGFLTTTLTPVVEAQRSGDAAADTPAVYGSGAGAKIVLTNSGFGLGGYVSWALGEGEASEDEASLVIEAHLVSGKDEREAAFFDRFGRRDIPEKANYLLIAPLRLGIQRRLLSAQIEDNFRPYVQVAVGPTAGWAYPYFDDADGDGERGEDERVYGTFAALPEGEPRFGFGGLLAIGAHFGAGHAATRSLRFGYAFDVFRRPVQLLEPGVKEAQRYFGTPTIVLTIGRLF